MCCFFLISPGWPESDDVLAQMVVSWNIQYNMNMHHGVPISSVWSLRAVGIITISKLQTIPILNNGGLKCFFQGNSFIFNPSAKLVQSGMAWHQQVGLPHQSSHRALTEWSQYTIHLAGKRLNRAYAESCASPSSAHHFFDIHLVAMISSVTSFFTGWRFLSTANTYTYNTYSRVWVYLLLSIFDSLLSLNDSSKLQQLRDPAHSPGTELVLESTTPMTSLRKPTLNTLALPKARSRTKTTFETLLLTSCSQKPQMFPSPNSSARLLHARETVKVPRNEWYFLEAEASVR